MLSMRRAPSIFAAVAGVLRLAAYTHHRLHRYASQSRIMRGVSPFHELTHSHRLQGEAKVINWETFVNSWADRIVNGMLARCVHSAYCMHTKHLQRIAPRRIHAQDATYAHTSANIAKCCRYAWISCTHDLYSSRTS